MCTQGEDVEYRKEVREEVLFILKNFRERRCKMFVSQEKKKNKFLDRITKALKSVNKLPAAFTRYLNCSSFRNL